MADTRSVPSARRAQVSSTLFTRIVALVLATIIITQLIGLALLSLLPPAPPTTYALSSIAEAIRNPDGSLNSFDAPAPVRPDSPEVGTAERLEQQLASALGLPAGDVTINLAQAQGGQLILLAPGTDQPAYALAGHFEIAVRQPDGSWRHYEPKSRLAFDSSERRFILLFLLAGVITLPLAWWFAGRLAAPLADLADSAERIGRDPGSAPPAIAGPAEVERAARAVAGMQQRIAAFVEDRTAMLGAIAHDLRTPLTRLAFRADAIPGPEGDAIRRDLADMNAMVESSLAYVRGAHQAAGDRRPIELGALVEQVAADLAMTGRPVTADIEGRAVVQGDPVSLARILSNLMENAAIHGGGAAASMAVSRGSVGSVGSVRVFIDDEGRDAHPADGDLEHLFEPFVRGDPARRRLSGDRDCGPLSGGSGLGLATARSLARAHGGDVTLTPRPEGGLRATLELPLV